MPYEIDCVAHEINFVPYQKDFVYGMAFCRGERRIEERHLGENPLHKLINGKSNWKRVVLTH